MAWLKSARFWIIFVVIFLFLRIPTWFEPNWYGDEGIYLTIGQSIRQGQQLYTEIHDNKPPFLYYLAALGQNVFGFRLLLTIWMIPTIWFFYSMLKRFFSESVARIGILIFTILSCVPFIEGHLANAEIFMLLPTIFSIYLLCSQITTRRLLVAGLSLGLAFSIKVPVIAEFGFLCLWILLNNYKKYLKNIPLFVTHYLLFILSFLLPTLLWLIYFWANGAVNEFLFAALFQNFGYLSSWSTGSHSGSASQGGVFVRGLILLIFWVIVFIASNAKKMSKNTSFILLWFSATIFGSLLSTRPYPHYLIQVLPPLVLVIMSIAKHRLFLIPLFIFVGLVVNYKFYFYPTFSYYSNFYSYIFNQKPKTNYYSYFGSRVNTNYRLADYINKNSQPGDRIFVWGDEPFIYTLANRLPASKFTVAYHVVDFNAHDFVMNELKTRLPVFIVVCPMSNRPFPNLYAFIEKYYVLTNDFDSCLTYNLRQ